MKVDPSKDGKENILALTNAFTNFSHAFITPNQKVLTTAKILNEWFYAYGIPTHKHSDQSWHFNNNIMKHLYEMYGIEQSTHHAIQPV